MNKHIQISNIKQQTTEKPLLFIVGPTASGKSALALKLAKEIGGEIICADSQTVRRALDIGTAKPTAHECAAVPHYMLDIIEPYEGYNVAAFVAQAQKHITDIQERGKVPIIVGGTGLYIDALFFGYSLQQNDKNEDGLEDLSTVELQEIIKQRGYDLPENAQNPRHLVGVIRRGGKYYQDRLKPREDAFIYGMQWPDEVLKQRISERIDKMFERGFVDEVRHVLTTYGSPPKKFDAIGYPIVKRYIDGEVTEQEAKELFKRGDWQYARRQKAWLKRNPYITWFKPDQDAIEHILKDIRKS